MKSIILDSKQHSNMSDKIIIVYSGPHKPQMVKLKEWLSKNLGQFTYQLSSQFLLWWKIKRSNPKCIITYNKNLIKKRNVKTIKEYCANGGKLIALHHNVSSMMLRRPEWLDLMKINIVKGDDAEYPWSVIEGGDLYLTNLQPDNAITTKGIEYDSEVPMLKLSVDPTKKVLTHELDESQQKEFHSREKEKAIEFKKSEYFINHLPLPEPNRILLFGIFFHDPESGREFISNNGGWKMPYKEGMIYYLMPGHSVHDYHENYCNIIRNCILD